MKVLRIILILILAVTASGMKPKEATIEVTIKGNVTQDIFYVPLDSKNNLSEFYEKIISDSTGKFTFSAAISSPCITRLSYFMHSSQCFIIEPGKHYEITIDGDSGLISLTGDKSEAQVFMESLSRVEPRSYEFFGENTDNLDSIVESIDERLAAEIRELNNISCPAGVRDLIIAERQTYYSVARAVLASMHNLQYVSRKEPTPVKIMNIWKESTIVNPLAKKTQWYYPLQELTLWYHIYARLDIEEFIKTRGQKREQDLVHSHTLELARKFLPEDNREFFTATYLKIWVRQKRYEKELIELIDGFSNDFPQSVYLASLNADKEKVIVFHQLASQEWKDEWRMMDYQHINSLEEGLLPFKGKRVYVDIWSTTCGWCKKEFAHNDKLKQALAEKGVEMLYISLDRDNSDQRWKDMIKYYNLSGYHIRANREFNKSLDTHFGSFGIPRYLIVDKDGNIINPDAPRPSALEVLVGLL